MKTQRLAKPKSYIHGGIGSLHIFTAPHNRAKAGTTIPRGAPGRKLGTTTPKLPKQMTVHDVLNFKFPGR